MSKQNKTSKDFLGKKKALAGHGNKPTRGVYAIVNTEITKCCRGSGLGSLKLYIPSSVVRSAYKCTSAVLQLCVLCKLCKILATITKWVLDKKTKIELLLFRLVLYSLCVDAPYKKRDLDSRSTYMAPTLW